MPPRDEGFESLFACSLEIIEETRVNLSGSTLLKPHQREFRNLLRLRIRNVPQPTAPSTSVKPPFIYQFEVEFLVPVVGCLMIDVDGCDCTV